MNLNVVVCHQRTRVLSTCVACMKRLQYALNRASGEVNGKFYEKRSLNLIGSVLIEKLMKSVNIKSSHHLFMRSG